MNKILFCGDLVCPFDTKINYDEVKSLFQNSIGVANLEGAILVDEEAVNHPKWTDKFSLYSSPYILNIIKDLNIRYVSLCNNHVLDYKQPIDKTQDLLNEYGIHNWGLKNNEILKTTLGDKNLYILTFATFSNEHSLKLFNPKKVIKNIIEIKEQDSNALVAVYPHWGVEKFYYPEPADRTFAHDCVNAGADIIVGHHPHIIQPIEIYKGVTIIYSVGNFILPQVSYGDKKLVYKKQEVQKELVVEWDGKNVKLHSLFFDRTTNTLKINSEENTEKYFLSIQNVNSYRQYLHIYLRHASLLDILVRTRYIPTKLNEYISYFSRNAFRIVRKILIKLKIHNPY